MKQGFYMISFFTVQQSVDHFAAWYGQSDDFQVCRLLPHSAQQSRQVRKLLFNRRTVYRNDILSRLNIRLLCNWHRLTRSLRCKLPYCNSNRTHAGCGREEFEEAAIGRFTLSIFFLFTFSFGLRHCKCFALHGFTGNTCRRTLTDTVAR